MFISLTVLREVLLSLLYKAKSVLRTTQPVRGRAGGEPRGRGHKATKEHGREADCDSDSKRTSGEERKGWGQDERGLPRCPAVVIFDSQ